MEVYQFDFEGDEKTYENLVKHFFMFHDPTLMNRQEQDVGTQYASVIYVYDEKQVSSALFYALIETHASLARDRESSEG